MAVSPGRPRTPVGVVCCMDRGGMGVYLCDAPGDELVRWTGTGCNFRELLRRGQPSRGADLRGPHRRGHNHPDEAACSIRNFSEAEQMARCALRLLVD